MKISKEQIKGISESFDIINLEKIKFAELFFESLKETTPKYEKIFEVLKIDDARNFMNAVRDIVISASQEFYFDKSIQQFGFHCTKICGNPEEIPVLEKAWLAALEEWLGPWYTSEIESSWQEIFGLTYAKCSDSQPMESGRGAQFF
ncbi:globin [Leptospira gomenensis]|uniref:Globin n=1 Tax=Leptospira gomenensis TaxID=2484974 RepID=A0A5F1Z3A7_9LEPT|nr:globin [Leptospira gomenensis]TGK32433.1 globin [Leptospira gomenensis]TGK34717.1 globin [Leptospira gomenensis]TGK51113.1 globin [Leptospira gomenensis]TGK68360.1 globin [Leptospira gomenensis]